MNNVATTAMSAATATILMVNAFGDSNISRQLEQATAEQRFKSNACADVLICLNDTKADNAVHGRRANGILPI